MARAKEDITETFIIHRDCSERFLPLQTAETSLLAERGVQMAGISALRTSYEQGRPRFPYHLLLYTTSGAGWLTHDGQQTRLRPGDLFFAPAGSAHAYGLDADQWGIAWLHLLDTPAWRFLLRELQHVRPARELGAMVAAMEGYLHESTFAGWHVTSAAKQYAQIILTLVERELVPYADPRTLAMQSQFATLWEDVGASLGRPWTVAAMAKRLNLSAVQFNRLCKQYCGTKPMQHVRALRMQRARDLLKGSSLPIKRIADLVGYSDPLAFSTTFHRVVGRSPRTFRHGADSTRE